MINKPSDHIIVRELRNILADFKSTIEKESNPLKYIDHTQKIPHRSELK